MKTKKAFAIVFLLTCSLVINAIEYPFRGTIRNYIIHIPSKYKANKAVPLLVVLHGGGGQAEQVQKSTRFDAIADRENFIVLYPEGYRRQWNDGRETETIETQRLNIDDVGRFRYPIQHAWHEDTGFRKTIIVNAAVRKSKADYLIFIDGDCILHHKFISRHFLRKSPGRVLSGRRIMLNDVLSKRITNEMVKRRTFEKLSFYWKECRLKEIKRGLYLPFIFHLLNFIGKDYWAFGSNFSIHKEDFMQVNGYDESIVGRGLEDINLSYRFKLKGYRTWRLTYEAIQFHLFHNSDPVPHTGEEEVSIINPKSFYAQKGIN